MKRNEFPRKLKSIFALLLIFIFGLVTVALSAENRPQHIFLFIGDGMGDVIIEATEKALKGKSEEKLSFTKFPVKGRQRTASLDSAITDSAAAITAIACGRKTNNGMLCMTPEGEKLDSIAILAHRNGWKIGIISSVSMNHATPAGFYAQSHSRSAEAEIARAFAYCPFEFFAGGGLVEGKKLDPNSEDNLQIAIKNGRKIIRTREQLSQLEKNNLIYAYNHRLANEAALPWGIDYKEDDIHLYEFTSAGIKHLEGSPFFMMVEGGKIDWACHANDLATAVIETIEFDLAVKEAIKFFEKNKDNTLIIVTADHETGGLQRLKDAHDSQPSIVFSQKSSLEKFSEKLKALQTKADGSFENALELITEQFGVSDFSKDEVTELKKAWQDTLNGVEDKNLYGRVKPLAAVGCKLLAKRAGYKFTSIDHTGDDVTVFAIGAGSELFEGEYDNTDIFFKLLKLMNLKK